MFVIILCYSLRTNGYFPLIAYMNGPFNLTRVFFDKRRSGLGYKATIAVMPRNFAGFLDNSIKGINRV